MVELGIFLLVCTGIAGAVYFLILKPRGILSDPDSIQGLNKAAAQKAVLLRSKQSEEISLENVRQGGMLSFSNIGPMMETFDAQVVGRHLYKCNGSQWVEIEADNGDSKIFVSLDDDDLSITLKEPNLSSLGLSEKSFSGSPPSELTYDGAVYNLEETGAGTFCQNGNELEPKHFKFWDYETDRDGSFIGLTMWDDGSLEASYSVGFKKQQIQVLTNS